MKLVSYNIQYGKGKDGRFDLARIATEIADADVIAVEGDLSSDVRDVANVAYVWREGQLIGV